MADLEQPQVPAQQEPAADQAEVAAAARAPTPPANAARESSWLPSEQGKLPCYVRAHLRMKAFALLALQSLLVLGITALLDLVLDRSARTARPPLVAVILLGFVALVALVVLHCVQLRYPANYAMLAAFTLLAGADWGLGGSALDTHAHFQLLGIQCAAMCVATCAQALTLHGGPDGPWSVAVPLLVGWALGSGCAVLATLCLGLPLLWCGLAALVCLGQFGWLLLDVGTALQEGNPDDFMRVVVSMDSTLLVVVSIPLFIVAACLVHVEQPGREDGRAEIAAPAARRAAP